MTRLLFAFLTIALIASFVTAQSYRDDFSYPDGTIIPGWTEERGEWYIQNGRLYVTSLTVYPVHGFLTKDGYRLKDSVTEVTVRYDGAGPTIQSGGLLARANDAPRHSRVVFGKVQDNSTQTQPNGFDATWMHEYGRNIYSSGRGLAITRDCRVRFVVVDATATLMVDSNLDGTWDVTRSMTLTDELGVGATGCTAGHLPRVPRSSALDDFALFDAVTTSSGSAAPGATLTLNLRGRLVGATYQAACSLSNSGIPVDTRRIPLVFDAMMAASLTTPSVFSGFAGVLDATASATAQINLPNDPSLSGLRFYAGFVELSPSAPSGIHSISNDLPITIS